MNNFTFLFYDYETFGIHTALDKPAQFACIRTDINLNIVDIPLEFYCFPPADYLPDPISILVTGISPSYTKKYGLNEFEFSNKIHKQFSKPNTCIIGYNNIYFDDEITRNIFYRNFIDPYEWSWKRNNSRWDILDVLRACYALRPNGINWPFKENYKTPSFKLSDISKSNKIKHNQVHNAISDVKATIKVAKLLKCKQPKLFNYFFKYRKKKELFKIIDIVNIKPLVYVSRFFGSIRSNISIIAPIAWSIYNSNVLIGFDLVKNFENFLKKFLESTVKHLNYKTLFEQGIVFIHINRCPILAPINVIDLKKMLEIGINYSLYRKNLLLIRSSFYLKNKIKYVNRDFVISKQNNVDLQIYDGFFSNAEKKIIKILNVSLKNNIFDRNIFISNNKIKNLFMRCIARNYPHMLNDKENFFWMKYCKKVQNTTNIHEYTKNILHLLKLNKNNFKNILLLKDLLRYVNQFRKNFFS
ncbi:MAG: exodeoxyribonuclease I [Buchnera aphidicola (Nurudea yanoniella)]